jgi:hypothetical protein
MTPAPITLRDAHRHALNIGPDYLGEHAAIFGERCEDCEATE